MAARKSAGVKKKKPAKKAPNARRPRSTPLSTDELRIRMYNVGFGDAFLVRLPTSDGERTMLIDCGQHMGGIANPMNAVLDDLIASVTVNGTPRIDIVIATHRHFDHISGFDSAKWKTVEVGEVWLPWTEKRGDPAADSIRQAQLRMAAAIMARFATADTRIGWFALNSFSNRGAERTLLQGFVGVEERRYLPQLKRADRTFTTPRLPGVTVHALGPSHAPDVIATMHPPEDQAFRALAALAAETPDTPPATKDAFGTLFAPRYVVDAAKYAKAHRELASHADTERVIEAAEEDLLGAASAMEDAINGTSLMLVFEIGDQTLLFAGDCEWGTWSEVLADQAWRELLSRTTVYKVSHHGSFNGTPTGFANDLLPNDATSLMSFRPVEKWPSIPRQSLVDALADHSRTLVRSDQIPNDGGAMRRNGDLWVEVSIPVRA
jgi:beta-lactamase superfamily II metal-dependent hydrolase